MNKENEKKKPNPLEALKEKVKESTTQVQQGNKKPPKNGSW